MPSLRPRAPTCAFACVSLLLLPSAAPFRPSLLPRRPLTFLPAASDGLPSYLTESAAAPSFSAGARSSPAVRLVSAAVAPPPAHVDQDERLAADVIRGPPPPIAPESEIDLGTSTQYQNVEAVMAAEQEVLAGAGQSLAVQDLPYGNALTLVGQGLPYAIGAVPFWFLGRKLNRQKLAKEDILVADFAVEFSHHDGNPREMRACLLDYRRKLPRGRRSDMVDAYLAEYFKVQTVSLQTVANLAAALTLLGLDEVQAARRLVAAGELLRLKPSSRSKCLFFGERILKGPAAREALRPLREMLASNYRRGGATIVQVSQTTMAEAAYKSVVTDAGPDQTSATPGYDVLGLSADRAAEIFEEVRADNFQTTLQQQARMISSQKEVLIESKPTTGEGDGDGTATTDIMAQVLEESADEIANPKQKASQELSIYECAGCGYTLFPSAGRDFKFFPDDFVCPECQAAKDQFIQKKQPVDP